MATFDVQLVLPVVVLVAYALLGLLCAPFHRVLGRWFLPAVIALPGLVLAGAFTARCWRMWAATGPMVTAGGLVRVDGFGLFFSFLLLIVGALTVLGSPRFLEREEADHGEFYPLVLLSVAGMIVMLQTTHLLMVLVGLEAFSLALYVLTGLTRQRVRSVESALKYFLLGAFSSGFLVYGMALLYGAAGSLDLATIGEAAAARPSAILWLGMGLVLIGLAFKVAVVPFHHWVPDVYQGAPTNVAAFMAAATKTAAFAVILRFLVGAFGEQEQVWVPLVTVLSILTMTVANLVALAQTNIKRLLAFSSISHAGYLLIAVVSGPRDGVPAVLFYLAAYVLMTLGAFAVAAAVGRADAGGESGYNLDAWAGLGWRRPWLGVAMSLFLFSLAGIPPTGGFLAKYVVFQAAVRSGSWLLAVVGVLNAVVGAYYYLRVVVALWMKETEQGEEAFPLPVPAGMAWVMALSSAGVLYLGLAPGRLLDLVESLAESLL